MEDFLFASPAVPAVVFYVVYLTTSPRMQCYIVSRSVLVKSFYI